MNERDPRRDALPSEDTLPGMPSTRALSFPALAKRAREMEPEEFVRCFGAAFLLHEGPLDFMGRLARAQNTMIAGMRRTDLVGHPSAPMPLVVFPVRHTGRSPTRDYAFVGRAKTNDIVLGDFSVSKVHAFFRVEQEPYRLEDARSKNGTFLNDIPVCVQARSPAPIVESGALVRFGAVEFTFLYARELLALAARSELPLP